MLKTFALLLILVVVSACEIEDVDQGSIDLNVALSQAVCENNVDATRELLKRNANPNYLHEGETALMRSVSCNSFEDITELLLDYHAEVRVVGREDQTALHYAIRYEDVDKFDLLIHHYTADRYWQDMEGNTPLILAAKAFHGEHFAWELLNYGVSPYTENREGMNACDYAALKPDILDVFHQRSMCL